MRGRVAPRRPGRHLGQGLGEAQDPLRRRHHRQGLRAGEEDRGSRAVAAGRRRRSRQPARSSCSASDSRSRNVQRAAKASALLILAAKPSPNPHSRTHETPAPRTPLLVLARRPRGGRAEDRRHRRQDRPDERRRLRSPLARPRRDPNAVNLPDGMHVPAQVTQAAALPRRRRRQYLVFVLPKLKAGETVTVTPRMLNYVAAPPHFEFVEKKGEPHGTACTTSASRSGRCCSTSTCRTTRRTTSTRSSRSTTSTTRRRAR